MPVLEGNRYRRVARRMVVLRLACRIILLVSFLVPALAQDAASQIQQKIQEIQQSLTTHPVADPDYPSLTSTVGNQVKATSDLLSAGRIYSSLERLSQMLDYLQGARFVADNRAETVKGGFPAYEAAWRKVSEALDASDRQARAVDWEKTPAAVRALAETSRAKVTPLLEAGRGFATAMQPKDGLFYLGEAQGQAAFVQFCASLHFPAKANAPSRRSLLPEIETLQAKANAAFVPPRSIELHPRFIQLNSALKLARELDAARFYSGALYQYLQALFHYEMLNAIPPDANGQSALKEAILNARNKFQSSDRDDSIAQLAIEQAAQILQTGGAAPSADNWRSAQVIMDQVLPAYLAALRPGSLPQPTSAKAVEITLVRWPYT